MLSCLMTLTSACNGSPACDPGGRPRIEGAVVRCETHRTDVAGELHGGGQSEQSDVVIAGVGVVAWMFDDLGHRARLLVGVRELLGFTSKINQQIRRAGAERRGKRKYWSFIIFYFCWTCSLYLNKKVNILRGGGALTPVCPLRCVGLTWGSSEQPSGPTRCWWGNLHRSASWICADWPAMATPPQERPRPPRSLSWAAPCHKLEGNSNERSVKRKHQKTAGSSWPPQTDTRVSAAGLVYSNLDLNITQVRQRGSARCQQ